MEVVSMILSIIAIIIALCTPIIEYILNKRLSKNGAVTDYLRDALSEPVFVKLPTSFQEIHLNEKSVVGTEATVETLREIRKKVFFYKHIDNNFYEKYKKLIQELEDVLITTDQVDGDTSYVDFYNKVTDYINQIYKATAEHLF